MHRYDFVKNGSLQNAKESPASDLSDELQEQFAFPPFDTLG
jgi:hypothetical protein